MDFGETLAYYTCVFDYRGGTYVRQFPKEDFPGGLAQAVTDVLNFLETPVTSAAEQANVDECWRELVALTGMHKVWCTSLRIHNKLFIAHVIGQ